MGESCRYIWSPYTGVYEKNNYTSDPEGMSTCPSKENAADRHSLNQCLNCFLFSEDIRPLVVIRFVSCPTSPAADLLCPKSCRPGANATGGLCNSVQPHTTT